MTETERAANGLVRKKNREARIRSILVVLVLIFLSTTVLFYLDARARADNAEREKASLAEQVQAACRADGALDALRAAGALGAGRTLDALRAGEARGLVGHVVGEVADVLVLDDDLVVPARGLDLLGEGRLLALGVVGSRSSVEVEQNGGAQEDQHEDDEDRPDPRLAALLRDEPVGPLSLAHVVSPAGPRSRPS